MTFLSIQNIARSLIFILRFRSENDEQTDEFLLTDDLKTVQLQNLHDIFQGDRNHPLSRFKARSYDLESDVFVLKEIWNRHQNTASIQRNCSCLICFGIDGNREFREIHIPVSKALFLKAIKFSPGQDTILSTRDAYDIIYNLFMILDNTNIIACILLKQLLADEWLFDKLMILHKENVHSIMINYQGTLEARNIEIKNQENILHMAFANIYRIAKEEFIFLYKDEDNNVALTTSKDDHKRKPHVIVDVNLRDLWKSFLYLKIYSDFLSVNYLQLQELLYRNSLFTQSVTLDIDFSGFYQFFRLMSTYIEGIVAQSKILEMLLPGTLEHVNAFRLRLTEITCSIDFRFLKDKKTSLICNNLLLLASEVYLPQNLQCIYIHDSGILGNLILPGSTKAISIKRVTIDSKAKITLNDECLRVEIEEKAGDIDIPETLGVGALSFDEKWKKCHIIRNNTGIIVKLSIVGADLSRNWVISRGMKNIYFESINTGGIFKITIHADCENLSIKNFIGVYDLTENALLANFNQIEFSGDHEFHLSNESMEYKLNIRNMHLSTVSSLNEKIKTIVFENVNIQEDRVFSIHIGCKDINLKNCRGSFEFFVGTNVVRIGMFQSRNCFSLQFNEYTGKYKVSFIEINIETNWMFWNKLEELHLEWITNESREYLEIKDGCDKIKLLKCKGFFKIPGIQDANLGILKLNKSKNKLCLTKLPDNLFLLHMSNIFIYETTHILLAIRSAKLEGIVGYNGANIEFKAHCEILFLVNCNMLFKQSKANVNERLILCKMFEIDYILKAQTKELFVNNCTITKNVQLCNTLYKLHFYDVKILKKNTVTIPEQCMNIMVKRSFGAFLIPGLNEHENRAIIFFKKVGGLHFSRYKDIDQYLLRIENCSIDGRICIRKDIKNIVLSNIMLNPNRFQKKIDKRTIIDSISLQSLTLKYSPFLYNTAIHKNLIHLHLEGMYFNHDVVVGDSIRELILKDITIKMNSSVVLKKAISSLVIYNFNGLLSLNGFLNFKRLRLFGDEKIVYEKKLQSGTVYLKIENLTFISDYKLAEEVETFHLTQIKTKNNSKILVNSECKKIVGKFKGKYIS